MYQDTTVEDILRAITHTQTVKSPGLNYDISARTSNREREELNNITIKELNNSSRDNDADVIVEQSPLRKTPSSGLSQEVVGSNITPARTTSRYSGICVQQPKPKAESRRPGLKLAISLQTESMSAKGHLLLLTAELKRYDRLREIKPKIDDSSYFAQLLEQAKREIHAEKDRTVAMGRVHLRGKRSAWIPNALVVACVEKDQIKQVVLFLDDEEYAMALDQPITLAQQPLYTASGQWGAIAHPNSHSPTLAEIIAEQFGQ